MLDYDCLIQHKNKQPRHIFLVFHGLGADKHNLKFLFDLWPDCDLASYFFQAPRRYDMFFKTAELLPSWFDLTSLENNSPVLRQQIDDILEQCHKIIQADISKGAIIHVAGFSQGGVMALAATEYFSCRTVGLFSTFWPSEELPEIIGRPIFFQSHGLQDTIVPQHAPLKLNRMLKKDYIIENIFETHLGHEFSWQIAENYRAFIAKYLK